MTSVARVCIVGAGLSGLFVANHIPDAIVFDARSRVGGRLLSDHDLDLGASWHWANEKRIAALANALSIETLDQRYDGDTLIDGLHGVGTSSQSMDGPSKRFVHGAQGVAQALHQSVMDKGGDVRLHWPIESISSTGDGCDRPRWRLTSAHHHDIECEHVVIALPPVTALATMQGLEALLADDVVAWAKEMPVWMGGFVKVAIEWDTPFWREHGWSGAVFSHVGPMTEMHNIETASRAALFGFVPPGALTRNGGRVSEDDVVVQLKRVFGAAYKPPVRILIQDWSKEPWTTPQAAAQGDRSFGPPPRVTPGISFCSTETSRSFGGHMEGALEAAERAIEEVPSTTS